jgi:hypothetical protein
MPDYVLGGFLVNFVQTLLCSTVINSYMLAVLMIADIAHPKFTASV